MEVINIGTGKGYSVLDVINAFEEHNGVEVPYVFSKRREGDAAVSYADCKPDTYHVEFYDMSAFDFCCWDGEVEFTNPEGDRAYLSSFSSSQKYVILEQGHVWTMDYAFYEYDIGFIVNGENYGGNNDEGESGSITIDIS